VYSCIICGSWAVAVCPGVRGPCPFVSVSIASQKLEHALSQYRLPLEESVPLFAPLLSLPIPEKRCPPLNLSPQRQRQKTLETIVALLLEQAEQHPVLFILEDLHWTDPTTLEFLNLLIEQIPTAALLALFTPLGAINPISVR
jgi:predicted ATPase